MKGKVVFALCIAAGLQFAVLTGMYLLAALPLWTGSEIHIKTIPVDPRSIFRGNYARLRYDISELDTQHFPDHEDLRNGEIVYTVLEPGENNLYTFSTVSLEQPDSGIYLRGRIQNGFFEEDASYFRIKYGVEAFFAPKARALSLEKQLRDGGIAVLMVSDSGKARLKDVIPLGGELTPAVGASRQ